MNPFEVACVARLNEALEKMEYQLLELSREYVEEIKAENPDDYELELVFEFCAGEEDIASWFEDMKAHLKDFSNTKPEWGLRVELITMWHLIILCEVKNTAGYFIFFTTIYMFPGKRF